MRLLACPPRYADLFHPEAECIAWFGPTRGVTLTPSELPRSAGRTEFWNRVQYFGDGVFAETHTVVFLDGDSAGCSAEALAVCTLDADGLLTRFETFCDMGGVSGGVKRAVPEPATAPDEVEMYAGTGAPADNIKVIEQCFSNIMLYNDNSGLFAEAPVRLFLLLNLCQSVKSRRQSSRCLAMT
jgi:hypothetical protein